MLHKSGLLLQRAKFAAGNGIPSPHIRHEQLTLDVRQQAMVDLCSEFSNARRA